QRIQPAQRTRAVDAVGNGGEPGLRVARQVPVRAHQHRAGLRAEALRQAQYLGLPPAFQPGLVASAQARRAPPGQEAQGDVLPRDPARATRHAAVYLRWTWRIRRFFFATWRSVSTFFLSL